MKHLCQRRGMAPFALVIIALILLIVPALAKKSSDFGLLPTKLRAAPTSPEIEVANQSGVAGYTVGIFGSGFGSAAGSVSILGTNAPIEEWADTFVKVVIPSTNTGTGELRLTTSDGSSTASPFQLYTIDPEFLNPPDVTFRNIAFDKPVALTNAVDRFCYSQPENERTEPTEFLTNYRCGHAGITGDGHVRLNASVDNGAIIAVDLETSITGTHYFQFFNSSNWYTGEYGVPQEYVIEVSGNSTDGIDGTWTVVHSETGNGRASRLHQLDMPTGGARWVRLRVTLSDLDDNQFLMKELRLFEPFGDAQSNWDLFAFYGDSITAGANQLMGHVGLAKQIQEIAGGVEDLPLSVYGLSGQNSGGLEDRDDINFDIYDAFALDSMGSRARYWAIALGTNDSGDDISKVDESWTAIGGFDERLDAILQEIIGRGAVPLVARIPDTDEAQGGFGTLATKKKILADIDRFNAQYQLIPGPDLYTVFRYNIEFEGSSWIRAGDGTHHSNDGRLQYIQLWAQAFAHGTNRSGFVTQPVATSTPTSTDTPVPTDIPAATSTPTETSPVESPAATSTPTQGNELAATLTPLSQNAETPVPTPTSSIIAPTSTPVARQTPQATSATPTLAPISTAVTVPAQSDEPMSQYQLLLPIVP